MKLFSKMFGAMALIAMAVAFLLVSQSNLLTSPRELTKLPGTNKEQETRE